MHVAASSTNTSLLKGLVHDHHADIRARLLNGSSPIHSAASRASAQHVKLLLDADAPINDKNESGRTPLHCAAENGNWETLEVFLDRGAAVNVVASEDGANTALEIACVTKEPKAENQAAKPPAKVSTGALRCHVSLPYMYLRC